MAAFVPSPTSMTETHALISLAEAARNPLIKYRSVEGIVTVKRRPARKAKVAHIRAAARTKETRPLQLVPLSVAQRRANIKYRDEGFEMEEADMTAAQKYARKVTWWMRRRDL